MVRQGNYLNPSPEQIARYEKALALRREGKLLREIGTELGVGTERARQIIILAARSAKVRGGGNQLDDYGMELMRRGMDMNRDLQLALTNTKD